MPLYLMNQMIELCNHYFTCINSKGSCGNVDKEFYFNQRAATVLHQLTPNEVSLNRGTSDEIECRPAR